MSNVKTTIAIDLDVRDKLLKLKVHPRQSFNEVLRELLKTDTEPLQRRQS